MVFRVSCRIGRSIRRKIEFFLLSCRVRIVRNVEPLQGTGRFRLYLAPPIDKRIESFEYQRVAGLRGDILFNRPEIALQHGLASLQQGTEFMIGCVENTLRSGLVIGNSHGEACGERGANDGRRHAKRYASNEGTGRY